MIEVREPDEGDTEPSRHDAASPNADVARPGASHDTTAPQPASRTRRLVRKAPSPLKRKTQRWATILHVYTSMIALLAVLFFAITGVTANHPDWAIGTGVRQTEAQGSLPDNWKNGSDPTTIDWLVVSDFLRDTHAIRGAVSDKRSSETEASINYKGPGFEAAAFINDDGTYKVSVLSQGVLGVMNDLHKGRDANSTWHWLIDVSAVFLALVAATGIVMQLILSRRRRAAFVSAGVGAVLTVVLCWLTLR